MTEIPAKFEGVRELHPERNKLARAQNFDELITAIEEIGSFDDPEDGLEAEDILTTLGSLLSYLKDLKTLNEPVVCNLTEFTETFGLRQAIGRLLLADGYEVNPAVFRD